MKKIINYLKDVKAEMKNVVWPTRKTAITHTLLVIVISISVAAGLYLADGLLAKTLGSIIN